MQAVPIDLPVPSMMHDFAITRTRVVFFDSPFVFDWSLAATGFPWRWDAEHGASIGVMDRSGGPVRWMRVRTGHLSHAANAWDDGDAVVLTGTRIDDPTALPLLHEWRIDPVAGTVDERPLWDAPTEYPRLADRCTGHENRFVYTTSFFFTAEPDHGEINKHDSTTTSSHRLPAGHTCGEPVHVARSTRAEDDGYLLTFAHDRVERFQLSPRARLRHPREARRGPPPTPRARRLPRHLAAVAAPDDVDSMTSTQCDVASRTPPGLIPADAGRFDLGLISGRCVRGHRVSGQARAAHANRRAPGARRCRRRPSTRRSRRARRRPTAPRPARQRRPTGRERSSPARSARCGSGRGSSLRCCGTGRA